MSELETTQALLSGDLPDIDVPNYPLPEVDSDEEEVFFGPVRSHKEKFGKNAR